ncbi:MAG: sugar phosphate isomerase/epimerase [Limnochordaceae bacterium]|nr:sugar phosphate isomerase/epimerase [Limnochordaceae bacterium]
MKSAVSMWSLHREAYAGRLDVAGFVRWAQGAGFGAVELLDVFWKDEPREVPEIRALVDQTGLVVAAYDATNDFAWPDAARRAEQVQRVRRAVDTAVRLAAPVVRVFSGDLKPDVRWEDARGWVIEGLRECAGYARQAGVVLALENHGKLAGRSEQLLDIVRSVNSPALRLNLDPSNFVLAHEDPLQAVRLLAGLAVHAHVKGGDEVPWQAVAEELRRAGFQGYLSIEFEGQGDERAGVEQVRRQMSSLMGV